MDLVIDIIHSKKILTIKSMVMQEQRGCDACGVFSVVVATALCNTICTASAGEDTDKRID